MKSLCVELDHAFIYCNQLNSFYLILVTINLKKKGKEKALNIFH